MIYHLIKWGLVSNVETERLLFDQIVQQEVIELLDFKYWLKAKEEK